MKKYVLKSILSMLGVLSIFTVNAYAFDGNTDLNNNIEVNLSTDNNVNDTELCKYDLNDSSFLKKEIKESTEGEKLLGDEEEVYSDSVQTYNSSSETADQTDDTASDDLDNTSPNNAAYIDVNAIYGDTINAEGEQRWFLTHLDNSCKLTLYLQTVDNADVNYDLHLFSFDEETGSINEVDSSNYGSQVDEQLSAILDSGYYFICVNSVKGFDTENEFLFTAQTSDKYDAAEPDDNVFSSSVKTGTNLSINQTIDNPFDTDWMQITVPEKSYVQSTLGNVSSGNKYRYLLYNSNLELLNSEAFENGYSYGYTLEAGTYYVRVYSASGFDADNNYNLKINIQNYDKYLQSITYDCSANKVGRNVAVSIKSSGQITQECHAFVTFYGRASGAYRDTSTLDATGRYTVSASSPFYKIVSNPQAYMYNFQYAFVSFYVGDKLVATQNVY